MDFCCSQCGYRQDNDQKCRRCGSDTVHDLRSRRARELFEDIDLRLRDKREGQVRALSVVISMIAVIALWFIPGFWRARRAMFALPLLLDQILLMAAVALGVSQVLERSFPSRRFPFLDSLAPADRD